MVWSLLVPGGTLTVPCNCSVLPKSKKFFATSGEATSQTASAKSKVAATTTTVFVNLEERAHPSSGS